MDLALIAMQVLGGIVGSNVTSRIVPTRVGPGIISIAGAIGGLILAQLVNFLSHGYLAPRVASASISLIGSAELTSIFVGLFGGALVAALIGLFYES